MSEFYVECIQADEQLEAENKDLQEKLVKLETIARSLLNDLAAYALDTKNYQIAIRVDDYRARLEDVI